MATFNQTPSGQTSLALPINSLGLLSNSGGTLNAVQGIVLDGSFSATLSLNTCSTEGSVSQGGSGVYPGYRRKNKIISANLES